MAAEPVINKLLEQVLQGQDLTRNDMLQLLSLEDPEEQQQIFRAARQVRYNHFGHRVFMYGFVYFSNHCQNDCHFCYARKSNDIRRYRKSHREVIEIAEKLANSGVHLIDLTMGEDVGYLEGDALLKLAVYHSTGINLLSELVQVCLTGQFLTSRWEENACQKKWVSYEHLVVTGDTLLCKGEHVMSETGPLQHRTGFCGAEEALTNYRDGAHHWAGTFINKADTREALAGKRAVMMEGIRSLQKGVKR